VHTRIKNKILAARCQTTFIIARSAASILVNWNAMALLSLQNLVLSFGDKPLLDDVSFQIERGERVCLLGRNGEGKSTLLKVIAGEISPQSGEVALQKGARIAQLPQQVPPNVAGTVFEIIAGGSENGDAPTHKIEAIISRLRLDGSTPFAALSGGLKRRAWLGRTLISEPDILLLDEPTNHLDLDSITWLEEFLLRSNITLLFVTHDRAFLRKLATRIVEIDRGKLLNWECDYDTYLVRKEAALEAEEKQNALFDKRLAIEETWIRRGVEARRTKSLSRIRELVKMRAERGERRNRIGTANLQMQDAARSGHLVVEAKNANFAFDEKDVIRDFSTIIMRGDKVGIIGPNGSGKSTLLRLLLGQIEPQSGEVKLGTRLQVAYFDQLRAQIEDEKTVQQNVCGTNSTVTFNGAQRHIVGYLQEFLFSPERARTPAGVLSGGERNRLLLAKLFTQPANVLVLDEPTNDLDAETLELLENLLVEFPGTLLVVSHDRAFLNNVVTSTLVFEPVADQQGSSGEYSIGEYAGGYDDWQRARQANEPKVEPKKPAPKAPRSTPKPRKMSFKEQRDLEALPARIEALENEQSALTEKMSAPDFYKNNSDVAAATARLAELEKELSTAFVRWEELLELETQM
jgi:ATP-binding cassette subfamily F protein uup